MKAAKISLAIVTTVILLACIPILTGSGQEPKKKSSAVAELMQRKLKHSQAILEAIATNKFDKIVDNAEELISLTNQAEWQVINSSRYELHSDEFRRAAEMLLQKAKEKNIDGATLNYLDLTMTCVRCHQYVREVRDASLGPPSGERFAATTR